MNCSHKTCPPGQFLCTTTKKCILMEWFCDQESDCGDFSDELHINCSITAPKLCRSDQFTCDKSHLCIPVSKVCDRVADCPHGEDEASCSTTSRATSSWLSPSPKESAAKGDGASTMSRCGPDHFACANGRCVNLEWFCDDDDDCGDGSDESHAMCNTTCNEDEFHCKTGRPRRCILLRWRCDGDHDCSDGSDELGCETYNHTAPCRDFEFRCRNGQCVTRAFICDGDYDCLDKSDEGLAASCDKGCANSQFQCQHTKFCIDAAKRCNGERDCADESDEINCTKTHDCKDTQFYCGPDDHRCIAGAKVCDGERDCQSGRDESIEYANCTVQEDVHLKCELPAGKCAVQNSVCTKTAEGPRCRCLPGFKRTDQGCEDINECASDLHMCSQECLNTPGRYKCFCHRGYVLAEDGRTCIATGKNPPRLWVTSKDHIKLVTIPRNDRPVGARFVANLSFAVAMDYHYRKNLIAYSDIDRKAIFVCEIGAIDSSHPPQLQASVCEREWMTNNVSEPNGIAIDWIHDLLYWTDAHADAIRVVSLSNKQHHRTLISDHLDEPRAIVVEPMKGLMFWTDWGNAPKIERASMDGTNRQVIVNNSELAQWPNGLAIDFLSERLYFADAKLKHIVSMDYHGHQTKFVLKSWRHLEHPFGLSVFEDRVYWSDWESKGVHYANKFDGSSPTVVARFVSGSTSIRVYHEQAQQPAPNKCPGSKCAHLCLPASEWREQKFSRSHTCLCSDGYRLESQNVCVAEDSSPSIADMLSSSSFATRFITSLLVLMLACLACIAFLMWQKRRRDELRRWTFGQMVYASRRPDVVMEHPTQAASADHSSGGSYDHLRLSFDDDHSNMAVASVGRNDAVYRPTVTTTASRSLSAHRPPMLTSLVATGRVASSAVAQLVRRLTQGQSDSMSVPLTESMGDEHNEPVA